MYDIFQLPHDFLHRKFTKQETDGWDAAMHRAVFSNITEELTPDQKKEVSKWAPMDYRTKRVHDKAFGENKDRVVLPFFGQDDKITTKDVLDSNNDTQNRSGIGQHTRDVINTLHSKGFHTMDYHAGMAYHENTPNRMVKIGKILQHPDFKDIHKTYSETVKGEDGNGIKGADGKTIKQDVTRHISAVYGADPELKSKNRAKSIVITRNKYDVAGMATGRSWSSCMHMVEGGNRHYLPKDIEHGTLCAYMVHTGDDGIAKPIGRINLKKHVNGEGAMHFVQEGKRFGKFPKMAQTQVAEWAKEKYQPAPGLYTKHSDLYNDDGNTVHVHGADQLVHAPTEKLFRDVAASAHSVLRKPLETDEFGDFHGEDMRHHDALDAVGHAVDSLPDAVRAKHIGHALLSHAQKIDGDRWASDFESSRPEDMHGEDIVHHHANQYMEELSSKVKREVGQMDHNSAFALHTQMHDFIGRSEDPYMHGNMKRFHGHLVNHILLGDAPGPMKDHVIHNIMSDNDGHKVHYGSVDLHTDLTHATTNPRVHQAMHEKMIDGEMDHIEGYSSMNHKDYEHMGEHADLKLAHHVLTHEDVDSSHKESFMHGLNRNSHGEHIQHTITEEPLHDGNTSAFAAIGEHTRYPSVVNKLRTREDTNKSNKVFLATQNNIVESTVYFREVIGQIL